MQADDARELFFNQAGNNERGGCDLSVCHFLNCEQVTKEK
jgi:hypothetical protein